jgi:hypothetical protein
VKISARIRAYREETRTRQDFQRALVGAATPSHRQELLALAGHASRTSGR